MSAEFRTKPFGAGKRPAPLAAVSEPQEAAVTVGCVAATGSLGSLQGGDGIDGRTIRYLLKVNLARKKKGEEEERRKVDEMEQAKEEEDDDDEWYVQLASWRSGSWLKGAGPQVHPPRAARRGEGKRGRRKNFLESAPSLQLEFQQSKFEKVKVPQVHFLDRSVGHCSCDAEVSANCAEVSSVRLSTRSLLCYDWCGRRSRVHAIQVPAVHRQSVGHFCSAAGTSTHRAVLGQVVVAPRRCAMTGAGS